MEQALHTAVSVRSGYTAYHEPMTTLSITLEDAVARQLEARSAAAGQTPEAYARGVLSRVAGLPALQDLVAANEARLREAGYASEGEAARAIAEATEDVRRTC